MKYYIRGNIVFAIGLELANKNKAMLFIRIKLALTPLTYKEAN